jgi:hypothetical protein
MKLKISRELRTNGQYGGRNKNKYFHERTVQQTLVFEQNNIIFPRDIRFVLEFIF